MAKRKAQSNKESDDSTLTVEFEIYQPDERFSIGIRTQLMEYCKHLRLDPFLLTETIVEQVNIGSVIVVENDDTQVREKRKKLKLDGNKDFHVLGVASILNIKQHHKVVEEGLKSIRKKLESLRLSSQSDVKELPSTKKSSGAAVILGALQAASKGRQQIGLLIIGRINNIPDDVVGDALLGLREDVEWSLAADDCPDDEKAYYRFDKLIGIAEGFREANSKGDDKVSIFATDEARMMTEELNEVSVVIPTGEIKVVEGVRLERCKVIFICGFSLFFEKLQEGKAAAGGK